MKFGFCKIAILTFAGLVSITGLSSFAALGQEIEPVRSVQGDAVKSRPRPAYDPLGIHLGSFYLLPSVRSEITHDDNVFSASNGRRDDFIYKTIGSALLNSGWGRHMLNFSLSASDFRYDQFTKENHIDLSAGTNWRIDATEQFNITGDAKLARLSEGRGSSDAATGAAEITKYTKYNGSLYFNKTFNRLKVRLGGSVEHVDYDDPDAIGGGTVDQDFRDGTTYNVEIKKSYEFSPGYRFFMLGEGNKREFKGSATTIKRDSKGVEGRAGFEFEFSRLLMGEFSAGYLFQNYETASFKDVKALAAKGSVVWNPTRLMTVNLSGERLVSETSVTGASSHLDTILSAQIDYEILRNLIGSPNISYSLEDFQGISRKDKTLKAGFSLEYLANRYLRAGGGYTFTKKDSPVSGSSYEKNEISGWIKVQY